MPRSRAASLVPFLLAATPGVALASGGEAPLGEILPLWSVAPFALILLAIAVMPLVAPRFWEPNRNKAVVSAALGRW